MTKDNISFRSKVWSNKKNQIYITIPRARCTEDIKYDNFNISYKDGVIVANRTPYFGNAKPRCGNKGWFFYVDDVQLPLFKFETDIEVVNGRFSIHVPIDIQSHQKSMPSLSAKHDVDRLNRYVKNHGFKFKIKKGQLSLVKEDRPS